MESKVNEEQCLCNNEHKFNSNKKTVYFVLQNDEITFLEINCLKKNIQIARLINNILQKKIDDTGIIISFKIYLLLHNLIINDHIFSNNIKDTVKYNMKKKRDILNTFISIQ